MKKFVIFDFDGTLLDTLKGLTNASNLLMEKFNYPYRYSYDEVKEFIGDGARKLFLRLIHRSDFDEELEKQYQEFLKYYEETQYISPPFKGVIKTLKKLNKDGIKIIIYSNKPDDILNKIVNASLKDIKILKTQGFVEGYKVKPDVTLLNRILKENNLSPYEGLYVGDSYTDYLTAMNLHMDMIFLTYGYCHKEDQDKFSCIKLNNFQDILNYIK